MFTSKMSTLAHVQTRDSIPADVLRSWQCFCATRTPKSIPSALLVDAWWLQILEFLPHSDTRRASRTSKHFVALLETHLKRHLATTATGSFSIDLLGAFFASSWACAFVHTLYLTDKALPNGCRPLRIVENNVQEINFIGDHLHVGGLLRYFPQLVRLKLNLSFALDDPIPQSDHWPSIMWGSLVLLFRMVGYTLRKLVRLEVVWDLSSGVSDQSIDDAPEDLYDGLINHATLQYISLHHHINETGYNYDQSDFLHPQHIHVLNFLPSLTELDVGRFGGSHIEDLNNRVMGLTNSQIVASRLLKLSFPFLCFEHERIEFQFLQNLTSLEIPIFTDISTEFFQDLPHLRELTISIHESKDKLDDVTERHAEGTALSQQLPYLAASLTSLHIGCWDCGLTPLGNALSSLVNLKVFRITDLNTPASNVSEVLGKMSIEAFRRLEQLQIWTSPDSSVDVSTFMTNLQRFNGLTTLDLRNVLLAEQHAEHIATLTPSHPSFLSDGFPLLTSSVITDCV